MKTKLGNVLLIFLSVIFLFNMTNIKNVYADEIVETEIVVSKINNYEILSQMTLFPNHDNMNGCGMVAMSILLKFYNDIETQYKGMYVPSELDYSATLGKNDPNYTEHQSKANILRDELTEITPTIPLFQNATLPGQQNKG